MGVPISLLGKAISEKKMPFMTDFSPADCYWKFCSDYFMNRTNG